VTVCDIIDKAFGNTISFLAKMDFLKTINIFKIEKDNVWLESNGEEKLYGCKIESKSNRLLKNKPLEVIYKEIGMHTRDTGVYLYFVKKGVHQGIYAFTTSRKAINQISVMYNVPVMSGKRVVIALYEIFLVGEYYVTNDNRLTYSEIPKLSDDYFIPWELEAVSRTFSSTVEEGRHQILKKMTLYQGSEISNTSTYSPVNLFDLEWEGVIGMRIDVSSHSCESRLQKYIKDAQVGDREFGRICKNIIKVDDNKDVLDQIKHQTSIINVFAYIYDQYAKNIQDIESILGIKMMTNSLSGPAVVGKTLFQRRDSDYDMLVPRSRLEAYFSTTHKKKVDAKKESHFWGLDISGNFINYSFDSNTSPHSVMTGKTGAGKSRQAINITEHLLGFDKSTGKALRMNDINVRYTDVGFTVGNLSMMLKENYPDKVKIFSSKIRKLRFSLFNIPVDNNVVDDDALDFMSNLVGFSLEAQNSQAVLTGSEREALKKIVKEMLLTDKYSDFYLSEFSDPKHKGVYRDLVDEWVSKGYSLKDSHLSDLGDEYDYLKKPILQDVYIEVENHSLRDNYSEFEKEELKSLHKKLRDVSSYSFLTFHSNMKETEESFTYIDFDEIKEGYDAEFCVIYWLLVKYWTKIMKREAIRARARKLPVKPTYYFVDEAHNFFKHKSFVDLLISAVKEFRKYGGRFFFMSQELTDISEKVVTQLGTKIFVPHPEDQEFISRSVKKTLGEMSQQDKDVLKHIETYMMYIMNDEGAMGMKFVSNPKDDWFYIPNHPDFLEA